MEFHASIDVKWVEKVSIKRHENWSYNLEQNTNVTWNIKLLKYVINKHMANTKLSYFLVFILNNEV